MPVSWSLRRFIWSHISLISQISDLLDLLDFCCIWTLTFEISELFWLCICIVFDIHHFCDISKTRDAISSLIHQSIKYQCWPDRIYKHLVLFSVAKASLELQMSVCLTVCPSITKHANQPPTLRIITIGRYNYQPKYLSAIRFWRCPPRISALFATFKPFG